MKLLPLPNKRIRAEVIKDYYGDARLYCFSCGNATRALQEAGTKVTTIEGADRYISPKMADKIFGGVNVTSGCLIPQLMTKLALRYEDELLTLPDTGDVYVPCGSGETLFALSYFVNIRRLKPVISNYAPLQLNNMSPLYCWVHENFSVVYSGAKDITGIIKALGKRKGYFIDTRNQGLLYNK